MLKTLLVSASNDIQKCARLISAVIAVLTPFAVGWAKFHKKNDKIKVRFGPLEPPLDPGYWLHVINQSSHAIYLKDYGFVDKLGRLLSLPELNSNEPELELYKNIFIRGTYSLDKRGDLFEIGPFLLGNEQIGAFAITAGQKRNTIDLQYDIPWHKRFWIKFKVWWKPKYQC